MFVYEKIWVGFAIFDSVSILLKFTVLFNKMHGLFDVITSFKMKIMENPYTVLLPDL